MPIASSTSSHNASALNTHSSMTAQPATQASDVVVSGANGDRETAAEIVPETLRRRAGSSASAAGEESSE